MSSNQKDTDPRSLPKQQLISAKHRGEGLEIISYKRPIVQGWTLEDCQNKCKETDGCASIDIQEYKEGSDSRNLSLASQGIPPGYPNWDLAICTLYSLENTLVDSKGECHRGSGLLSCTGLPPKESLNADQKLLGATWKVNGFECHMARSCLKQEGLEIISYKRPIVQGWTLEDCQNKCKETDGCASIDIQEYKEGSDSRNLSLASQ